MSVCRGREVVSARVPHLLDESWSPHKSLPLKPPIRDLGQVLESSVPDGRKEGFIILGHPAIHIRKEGIMVPDLLQVYQTRRKRLSDPGSAGIRAAIGLASRQIPSLPQGPFRRRKQINRPPT